jgi:prevent-host-death family protein
MQTVSISDFRQNITGTINAIGDQPITIFQRSKPKAVIVDADYFQSLEDAVLDLTDSVEAEKAKKETKQNFQNYVSKRWGNLK